MQGCVFVFAICHPPFLFNKQIHSSLSFMTTCFVALLSAVVDEVLCITAAKQIELPFSDPLQRVHQVLENTQTNFSSMLSDVRRRVTTEIDFINGSKREIVHVCVCVCVFTHLHTHPPLYSLTHTHTHTHTHTRTHTRTRTLVPCLPSFASRFYCK